MKRVFDFRLDFLRSLRACLDTIFWGESVSNATTSGCVQRRWIGSSCFRCFFLLTSVFLYIPSAGGAETGSISVDLGDVRLHDSIFKQLQDLHRAGTGTTGYLNWLQPDRLLYDFRVQAGLPQAPGATNYGGWETTDGFVRGHLAGHYLSAASKMYAATGDASFLPKINAVVSGLAECQTALNQNGYLSAFPSTWFDTLESGAHPSVPYYTIHKIMSGLVDTYDYTGNDQALNVAIGMADYFAGRIAKLTSSQIETMFRTDLDQQREFGSMSDALTNLYVEANRRGDANSQRFLTLANVFNRSWFIDPLGQRPGQSQRLARQYAHRSSRRHCQLR